MGGIVVVTDSACDLPQATIDELGIKVVPLSIRFGDEELVDRTEISTKEFWDRVVTGPHIPATAAPSPGAFRQVFEEAAQSGADGVVCVNLSSGLSATYQAASTAAADLARTIPVRVIDSLNITCGIGLLVIEAAELAAQGKALDEVADAVEDMKARTKVYGVVGTLDYLKKGGRIGGAEHLFGSLLSIKPIIEMRGGKVEVESKQRTRSRAIQYLCSKAAEAAPLSRLAVANGIARDIDEVIAALGAIETEHELLVTDLGPVVGAHAGPESIGVCFIAPARQ